MRAFDFARVLGHDVARTMTNDEPPRLAPLPYNPYASPNAQIVFRVESEMRAPGEWVKWAYVALAMLDVGGRAAWPLALTSPDWSTPLAIALTVLWWGHGLLAATWLYCAWKGVPIVQRGTITPRRAALSLFIPFYGLYWLYVINPVLCDALDGILERGRVSVRAPRTLAQVAGAVHLAVGVLDLLLTRAHREPPLFPLVAAIVTSSLWIAYIFQCDPARRAVTKIGDHPATIGAARLAPLQQRRGPGVAGIALCGFAIIVFLGVWQFFSPISHAG